MKLAFICSLAFAATAAAYKCTEGDLICGHHLLFADSSYRSMMDAATEKAGVTDTHDGRQTLFYCTDSGTGDIEVEEVCKRYKCDDSKTGANFYKNIKDYCHYG